MITTTPARKVMPTASNGFRFPCHIELYTPIKPGWEMYQFVACVPSAPGRMRMMYKAYRN